MQTCGECGEIAAPSKSSEYEPPSDAELCESEQGSVPVRQIYQAPAAVVQTVVQTSQPNKPSGSTVYGPPQVPTFSSTAMPCSTAHATASLRSCCIGPMPQPLSPLCRKLLP